MKGWITCF